MYPCSLTQVDTFSYRGFFIATNSMRYQGSGKTENSQSGPKIRILDRFQTPQNTNNSVQQVCVPASVAQLDAPSDWRPGGRGFNPCRGRQHSFVEIDHEIFSTVILSLPLIQEGQLSVSGERMCTILVNRLED